MCFIRLFQLRIKDGLFDMGVHVEFGLELGEEFFAGLHAALGGGVDLLEKAGNFLMIGLE